MEAFDILYKEKVVYKALEELDEALYKLKVTPFTLNVVGGFALMIEKIRLSDYTDIDYIGEDLPQKIKEIIDEIGIRCGLGRGWINNDVLLSGSDLKGIETITGPLEFKHAFDLRVITVNALDKASILRMKVIAIDTSYSGIEFGGEFSRIKDFIDVKLLIEACEFDYRELVDETFDYVECPEIYFLIRYYLRTNDVSKFYDNKLIGKIIDTKGKENI